MRQFMSKIVKEGNEDISPKEAIEAVCEGHQLDKLSQTEEASGHLPVIVECLTMDGRAICPEYAQADLFPGSNTLHRMSQQDWTVEQRNDPTINRETSSEQVNASLTVCSRKTNGRCSYCSEFKTS